MMESIKLSGKTAAAFMVGFLLAATNANAQVTTDTEVSWGEWRELGDGYVARRKESPVPVVEKSSKNKSSTQANSAPGSKLMADPGVIEKYDGLWLETGSEGLYVLSIAELAAGLGESESLIRQNASRGRLTLRNGGKPVIWYFDSASDVLMFAAAQFENFYTDENAFYLENKIPSTKPMRVKTGKPTSAIGNSKAFKDTLKFEEEPNFNWSLWTVADEADADYWFWDYLYGGFRDQIDIPLSIPTPAATGLAEIRITLRGWTEMESGDEHHVSAEINGVPVGAEISFDAFEEAVLVAQFDQSILVAAGSNTLRLKNRYTPGQHPGQWLDAVEVDYFRQPVAVNGSLWVHAAASGAQKVSGFSSNNIRVVESPTGAATLRKDVRIEPDGSGGWVVVFATVPGADYVVSEVSAFEVPAIKPTKFANLANTSNEADYLIIAHRNFSGTAADLENYRKNQFDHVKVVWIDQIYSEFSFGRVDPYAIRAFMNQTKNWITSPSYVVILGRGTLDEKNRMNVYNDSFVPVLMASTPWSLAASDQRLLAGDGDAPYAIGRLPITSDTAGKAYVQKLIDYESASLGLTQHKALLIADNPDGGGDFRANSDLLATRLQDTLGFDPVSKLYHPASPVSVQASLANSNTWEVGFVSYDGHGSERRLGDENFLRPTGAAALTNSALPIFSALTCAAGNDTTPGLVSVTAALVLNPVGGVIASLSPTGLSSDADAQVLGNAFVDALYGDGFTVGKAVVDAKNQTKGVINGFMPRIFSVVGEPAVYGRD